MKIHQLEKEGIGTFIVLNNSSGLEVTLSTLGAGINSICLDGTIMTMSPLMLEDFAKAECYYGKTIGRVAGRVKDSRYRINGKECGLQANDGINSLHGGDDGFSAKQFTFRIEEGESSTSVEFLYHSPDGEGGYPGKCDVLVSYVIPEDRNEIGLSLLATPDADCPLSLTNHSYFTLGEKDIGGLTLTTNATEFVEVRPLDMIPLGRKGILPCLDFRKGKSLLTDIEDPYLQESKTKGYDHFLYHDFSVNPLVLQGKSFKLGIFSDMAGMQIYSHNYPDGILTIGSSCMFHRGLAIEPEIDPLGERIVKKGKSFNHSIRYVFSRKS